MGENEDEKREAAEWGGGESSDGEKGQLARDA